MIHISIVKSLKGDREREREREREKGRSKKEGGEEGYLGHIENSIDVVGLPREDHGGLNTYGHVLGCPWIRHHGNHDALLGQDLVIAKTSVLLQQQLISGR